MGFFSKLIGIHSFGGAQNALFVELMLPSLNVVQRAQLKERIIRIFQSSGFPKKKPDAVISHINDSTRIAQLNFIALAMNELGYSPPLKNEYWTEVRNPFDPSLATENEIWAVAKRLKSNHNVSVSIGSGPLNFDEW